ncbi:single-stranded DNA-binding protein [Corynebacterium sp. USCH3]|uniref:single-stranded DNA-binding protein n=1 Tax=Corynebacterium sp. USCH3 TaxID=3024840 RepID=UPI00309DCC6F
MAQGDTPITVVGNLVADIELRYTPSGAAVANGRVASTPRRYDSQSNQWVDGDALFITFNIWKQAAENTANSLTKGDRVIVTGRLRQRSFETREGEKRTVFEVEADEVGPSLKYATTQVTKTPRQGGNFGGQQPQGNTAGSFGGRPPGDDDPWNAGGQGNGYRPGFDDEPSF